MNQSHNTQSIFSRVLRTIPWRSLCASGVILLVLAVISCPGTGEDYEVFHVKVDVYVVEASSREPIPNAKVTIYDPEDPTGPWTATGYSNGRGFFSATREMWRFPGESKSDLARQTGIRAEKSGWTQQSISRVIFTLFGSVTLQAEVLMERSEEQEQTIPVRIRVVEGSCSTAKPARTPFEQSGIRVKLFHPEKDRSLYHSTDSLGQVNTSIKESGDTLQEAIENALRRINGTNTGILSIPDLAAGSEYETCVIEVNQWGSAIEVVMPVSFVDYRGPQPFSTDFSQGTEELDHTGDVVAAHGELRLSSSSDVGKFSLPRDYRDFVLDMDYSFVDIASYGGMLVIEFRKTADEQYHFALWFNEERQGFIQLGYIDCDIENTIVKKVVDTRHVSDLPRSSRLILSVKGGHMTVEVGGQELVSVYDFENTDTGTIRIQGKTGSSRSYIAIDNLEVRPLD